MTTPYPKRVDRFREWSKLMQEQAIVPDRVQYKSNGRGRSRRSATVPAAPGRRKRRKWLRRRRKGHKGGKRD